MKQWVIASVSSQKALGGQCVLIVQGTKRIKAFDHLHVNDNVRRHSPTCVAVRHPKLDHCADRPPREFDTMATRTVNIWGIVISNFA